MLGCWAGFLSFKLVLEELVMGFLHGIELAQEGLMLSCRATLLGCEDGLGCVLAHGGAGASSLSCITLECEPALELLRLTLELEKGVTNVVPQSWPALL